MSETQFEKLLKTLKTAERERDLARHTVDVQDKIINDLREKNERLRRLLERVLEAIPSSPPPILEIEKELGDECCQ